MLAKKILPILTWLYDFLTALIRLLIAIIILLVVLLSVGILEVYYKLKKLFISNRDLTGVAELCLSRVRNISLVYESGERVLKFLSTLTWGKLFRNKYKNKQLNSNRYGKKSKSSYNRINRRSR